VAVVEDERLTTAQRVRRRNVRLALIVAAVALAMYCSLWLKVSL
jgi:hypothetical protein